MLNKKRYICHDAYGIFMLAGVLFVLQSFKLQAQENFPPESNRLDSVVVVGSRSSDNTVLNSKAPVDVFSAQKIQETGYTNLNQALQSLSPSINFPQSNTTATTQGMRGVQMRGLGPDQVLILVNGKRRHANAQVMGKGDYTHGSQMVDLSTIPVSAIERIEILRDGASAQYGSDAIAGVINVILKEKDDGGTVKGQVGRYSNGLHLTKDVQFWKGLSLPNQGFLTFSGQGVHKQAAEGLFSDARTMYAAGDPREDTIDRRKNTAGKPRTEEFNFALNGDIGLNDAWRLYSFATYGWRSVEAKGLFRTPNNATQNVEEIYPDGYMPEQDARSKDFSLALGAKYASAWLGELDLSTSYGRNTMTYTNSNSLNPSYGLESDTKFYLGELDNEQLNLNLEQNKEIHIGLAEPVTLALGLVYRREQYEVSAGDDASWDYCGADCGVTTTGISAGSQGFTGWSPENEGDYSREVYGAYASLEGQLSEKIKAGVAGRYEDYSDFGSTSTGSLSLRYDFSQAVALRGNLSSGYRAPAIGQIGFSSLSSIWRQEQLYNVLNVPVDHPVAQALGAEPLDAEKSTNYSLGVVLRPDDSSSLTLDFYLIDIKDRITLTDNLLIDDPDIASLLSSYPGVGGASFYVNGLDTRTQGFDLIAKRRFDLLASDDLELSLSYNRNKTDIEKIKVDTAIFGKEAQGRITDMTPRSKLILGADFRYQQWLINLQQIRYGEFKDIYSPSVNVNYPDQTFRAQWQTNLQVKYQLPKLALSVGANNLFNSNPERSRESMSRGGAKERYSFRTPSDIYGRFIYLAAEYEF